MRSTTTRLLGMAASLALLLSAVSATGSPTVTGLYPAAAAETTVPVTGVSFIGIRGDQTITQGTTDTLRARVTPATATDTTLTWTSSDPATLTVTPDSDDSTRATITATKAGTATVTATAKNSADTKNPATSTVKYTVTAPSASALNVIPAAVRLPEGDTDSVVLTATVTPASAAQSVKWSARDTSISDDDAASSTVVTLTPDSSDPTSATVTLAADAKAGATAVITVTAGERSAEIPVTVLPANTPVASSLTLDEDTVSIPVSGTQRISATVKPSDLSVADRTVTWASSDSQVASVDQTGLVRGVAPGTATISAVTPDGIYNYADVTVTEPEITSVTLTPAVHTVEAGQSATFSAAFEPSDAADTTLAWASSDTSVATVTVDEDDSTKATVAALAAGEVTISATAANGVKGEAVLTVTAVPVAVSGVSLDQSAFTLQTGGNSQTLTATVSPSDASDKSVTWSSSNPLAATVTPDPEDSSKATVTSALLLLPLGTQSSEVTITAASAANPDVKAVAVVTVTTTDPEPDPTTSPEPTVEPTLDPLPTLSPLPLPTLDPVPTPTISPTVEPTEEPTVKPTADPLPTPIITPTLDPLPTLSPLPLPTIDPLPTPTLSPTVEPTVDPSPTPSPILTPTTPTVVKVSAVTVAPRALTIPEGSTGLLVAAVTPLTATDKTLTWSSSDTSVATVDANGTVSALKAGSAQITAASADGPKDTVTVTVTAVARHVSVTSVTLDQHVLALTTGSTGSLVATVEPDDATDKTLTWSSSDTSVATVDANGTVVALKAGRTTVTATSVDNESAFDSALVVVNTPLPGTVEATGVAVTPTSLDLSVGSSATITAAVTPANATIKLVTWESSNPQIATVDQTGRVTGVAAGTAIVTASTINGKTAAATVNVSEPSVKVTGVTISPTTLNLTTGTTGQLTAAVSPSNATESTVTWESSNPLIASVDQNGLVTALLPGNTTITATAGGVTAAAVVTVDSTTPAPSPSEDGVTLYRLYNPNTGEHLYTSQTRERDYLTGLGWNDENTAWVAPSNGADVYRLYNPNAEGGDHYYTSNVVERNVLTALGWQLDGVFFTTGGSVPVYCEYNPNNGRHNYTTNKTEHDYLVSIGWRNQSVAFYAQSAQ